MTASVLALLERLRAAGADIMLRDAANLATRDPGSDRRNFDAGVMALPGSVEALCVLMRACHEARVPVVPHGGRTGLVGGTVSSPGALIVSTERLHRILDLDPLEGTAVVEAGVTLEVLQQAAAAHGMEPGIDLGSRGSATIGGLVSTNAGGIQAFRYGVMRHRVLGLEAVLADGTLFSDLTRVVKSTAGYDVKQLFIGGEGTLGIVTRIVIKLDPLPVARATALLAVPGAESGLAVARHFARRPDAQLLAAEMMWRDFLLMNAQAHQFALSEGFAATPATLLVEVSAATSEQAQDLIGDGLETLWDSAGLTEGVIASSADQARRLWHLREDMSVFGRRYPGYQSFDVSVPPRRADAYIDVVRQRLAGLFPGLAPLVFGHILDGNLHIIPMIGESDEGLRTRIQDALYADLEGMGGSISAEHGVGLKKRDAFARFGGEGKRRLAALIKHALDPEGLLNPGKVTGLD